MKPHTRRLWSTQDRHEGDRWRLFRAVAGTVEAGKVLYPGSFVDIAPSSVFPSVTYVDVDSRTPRFFADDAGMRDIIGAYPGSPSEPVLEFIHGDYTQDLGLADEGFDLLISLYAGLVSEHCTRYLRIGGTLLVNPSHGDVAMASIDDRYELTGVIISRSSSYSVSSTHLDSYLVPKRPTPLTPESVRERGRGVAYTKSPFAYLFTRVT